MCIIVSGRCDWSPRAVGDNGHRDHSRQHHFRRAHPVQERSDAAGEPTPTTGATAAPAALVDSHTCDPEPFVDNLDRRRGFVLQCRLVFSQRARLRSYWSALNRFFDHLNFAGYASDKLFMLCWGACSVAEYMVEFETLSAEAGWNKIGSIVCVLAGVKWPGVQQTFCGDATKGSGQNDRLCYRIWQLPAESSIGSKPSGLSLHGPCSLRHHPVFRIHWMRMGIFTITIISPSSWPTIRGPRMSSPMHSSPILPPTSIVGAATWEIEQTMRAPQQSTAVCVRAPLKAARSEVLQWGHSSRVWQRFWCPSMTHDTRVFVATGLSVCPRDDYTPAAHGAPASLVCSTTTMVPHHCGFPHQITSLKWPHGNGGLIF